MKFSILIRRFLLLVLSFVMIFSMSACSDMSYIMSTDTISIPVGVYIYNEYLSYHDVESKVEDSKKSPLVQTVSDSSGEAVSDESSQTEDINATSEASSTEIDSPSTESSDSNSSTDATDESSLQEEKTSQNGMEWVKTEALNSCKKLLAVESKMQEFGLSLSDDELKQAQEEIDKRWPYYSSVMKKSGVSKESFGRATVMYDKQYDKVLSAMYDQNGKEAVPESELNNYFTSNYLDYQYISKSLTKYSSSSNGISTQSSKLSDEEIATIGKQFESFAERINAGESIEAISAEFVDSQDEGATGVDVTPKTKEELSLSDEVIKQFEGMKDAVATVYKTENMYYLLYKQDISKSLNSLTPYSELRISVLKNMKQDEFDKMLDEYINTLNIYVNQSVVRKYLPTFVEDKAISSSK